MDRLDGMDDWMEWMSGRLEELWDNAPPRRYSNTLLRAYSLEGLDEPEGLMMGRWVVRKKPGFEERGSKHFFEEILWEAEKK